MKDVIKGEYGEIPFGIIQQADILTMDDFEGLRQLAPELKETFLKSQMFRTRTEMEVSVLNDIKFPTHASKYWQAVREQGVMFHELVMLSYDYRKNLVEIKKLERELAKETDELERELKQIEIEKKTFIARNSEKVAKARIKEIHEWSAIKAREASFMSPHELKEVNNHQLLSYTKRWIKQTAIMAEHASQGEKQNLLGQLVSGLRECKDRGLQEQLIKEMPKNIAIELQEKYLLK